MATKNKGAMTWVSKVNMAEKRRASVSEVVVPVAVVVPVLLSRVVGVESVSMKAAARGMMAEKKEM